MNPSSQTLSWRHAAAAATAALLLLGAGSATAAELRGSYLTASGNFEVEVQACGDALCGVVSKVIADRAMSRPDQPMQAADPRPALGLKILHGVRPTGDAQPPAQWQGQIYNRENGKTYDCRLSLDAAGNLVLHAYVVLPLFGKTQVWQRLASEGAAAASDLPASSPR